MQKWSSKLNVLAWLLTAAVLVLAFIAWGQGFSWQFAQLNTYELFPLFGLVAFSTMWAQYVVGAAKHLLHAKGASLRTYYNITGWLVLAAILVHPGLLSWQLWRDGLGLPPGSELTYVGHSLHVAVVIGMTCLLIFLAFELRRILGSRPWWKYVNTVVDVAVVAIFIHALKLGTQTRSGWFQKLWWAYGLTLTLTLGYNYVIKFNKWRARSRRLRSEHA